MFVPELLAETIHLYCPPKSIKIRKKYCGKQEEIGALENLIFANFYGNNYSIIDSYKTYCNEIDSILYSMRSH